MQAPPEKLFKFVCDAAPRIIKSRTLKFSRPSELNDPFEVRPYIRTIGEQQDWLEQYQSQAPGARREILSQLPPDVRAQIQENDLARWFDSQFPGVVTSVADLISRFIPAIGPRLYEGLDARIGILCLTESFENLLMWSHYAKSHQGCVLEFNAHHPFFSRRRTEADEFYHLRKVVYSATRPSVDLMRTNGVEFFLTKSDAWAYEFEWRMMVPLSASAVSPGIDSFPAAILRAVTLGANSDLVYRQSVLEALADSEFDHVKIRLAKLNSTSYALDFETIREGTLLNLPEDSSI
jgi:Protein of unknown function (DUF2971)